ncbi:MAG: Na/Pi symporter [Bacilli bacterium]|nr:Na/Pi symporter [Bacilli bacterium]
MLSSKRFGLQKNLELKQVAGGLTLFLFGLNLMRDSLIKLNSEKLKRLLNKATGSKIKSLITGILATSLIQSSSGVTAIVVALICANFLSLSQGLMIMIGSNIGTTTTAFIFTLKIEKYSLVFIIIGYLLLIFKSRKLKNLGSMIIGFGILFLGIDIMNHGLTFISDSTYFLNLMLLLSNNSLNSFIGGTVISALIQSSSVTIGLAQNLYALGSLPLKAAISIMLGANLGTTLASLIVGISSTKEAKAALYVNLLFNLVGGLFFLIILGPFSQTLYYFEKVNANPKLTIAYAHLAFNLVSTLLFYFVFEKVISLTKRKYNLAELN